MVLEWSAECRKKGFIKKSFISFQSGGILPKRLQKVNITIVDIEECKSIHYNTVYNSNLCAGVPQGWKGQCNVSFVFDE